MISVGYRRLQSLTPKFQSPTICSATPSKFGWFLLGYRFPENESKDPLSGVALLDQFEEDENGLVFYWNGRGPPVRVTYQERDEIVERHQRVDRIFAVVGLIGIGAAIAAVAIEAISFPAFIIILAALTFPLSTIQDIFEKRMLRPFLARVPVGPARTRKELFLRSAREANWSNALLLGWPLMVNHFWPWQEIESIWVRLGVIGVAAIIVIQVLAVLGTKVVLMVTDGAVTRRLRPDRLG